MNGQSGTTSRSCRAASSSAPAASTLPKPWPSCASSTSACVIARRPLRRRYAARPIRRPPRRSSNRDASGLSITSASSGEPAAATSSAVPRKYSISCPGASDAARVDVVGEAAPVRGGVLPRLALAQMVEDPARPDEEAAVLGLEHGDLVGACEILKPVPLARPRLDLARDEVEPELRQHLPHRRGERAPLRLVERQHAVRHRPRR